MTAARTTTEPYWDLVEQSFEEAAFLWKRWEADLASLTRNLDEVQSWTEERLQGALDGVRVAGDGIARVVGTAFEGRDLAAVTVAAHLLAARSPPSAREALAAVIREARGARLDALVRGIETSALDGSFAPVTAVLGSSGPEHGAALCRIKAFRRVAPGREVIDSLESNVPRLQAEALRSLGLAADESQTRHIVQGLKSDSAEVRLAAVAAGIRRRVAGAWDAAVQLAEERNPACAPLLPALAALGTPEERQIVLSALREPALQRAALFALAYVGTPEAVEICLTGMRDEKLARAAAESYCAITGADLGRDQLAAPEPADGPPPAFEDDPLDADLVPSASEQWPLPDVDAVRRHWQGIRGSYAAGVRHWRGRPASLDTLLDAVETGPMLRRGDLAHELSVRTGGQFDVEPRAFAHVQRRMMRAARLRRPAAVR